MYFFKLLGKKKKRTMRTMSDQAPPAGMGRINYLERDRGKKRKNNKF